MRRRVVRWTAPDGGGGGGASGIQVLIVREKRSCEVPDALQECSRHLPVRRESVIMVLACLSVCAGVGFDTGGSAVHMQVTKS